MASSEIKDITLRLRYKYMKDLTLSSFIDGVTDQQLYDVAQAILSLQDVNLGDIRKVVTKEVIA